MIKKVSQSSQNNLIQIMIRFGNYVILKIVNLWLQKEEVISIFSTNLALDLNSTQK